MLRWERFDGIAAHNSGKTIVCGHTPQRDGCPRNRGYAICIDTDPVHSGVLTCLETTGERIWQTRANGRVTRAHLSDFDDD